MLKNLLLPAIGLWLGVATGAARAQTTRPIEFAGDPRMGVCTHFAQGWNARETMPLIEQSGFGWIRDDLAWESVEKKKGEYALEEWTRNWIHAAHAHHLRVLLILNGSNSLYADRYDARAFARWGAWVATALKDDVDALEILNEPNNFGFSKYYGGQHEGEGDSPWIARYAALMNQTADAIKAANPNMPVIGFGAGAPATYQELRLSTSAAVDAIADHPYSNQSVPELVPAGAADQMKKFGFTFTDERGSFASLIEGLGRESNRLHGPKKIWLTEWGFSTYQPLADGQFGGFTESAQAKYILRRFVEGFGLGVEASFLYEFRDGHDPHDAEGRWGVVGEHGEPKPSFAAVANLARIFHGVRRARSGEVGDVNVFPIATWPQQSPIAVYRFIDSAGRPAVAIWATDRADGDRQPRVADVELVWGAGVREIVAIDTLTGKSSPVEFKRAGQRLVKEAMPIRDYPIVLEATEPMVMNGAGAAAVSHDLKLFDGQYKWTFNNGQEFPGAAGTLSMANDGDMPVAALHYDFRHGGAYVAAQAPVVIAADLAELRIGVKAAQSLRISIRVVDATGQCHQFVKSCGGTGAWETLRVRLDGKASEHWGGLNDGMMHLPAKELSLCVGRPPTEPLVNAVEFGHIVGLEAGGEK